MTSPATRCELCNPTEGIGRLAVARCSVRVRNWMGGTDSADKVNMCSECYRQAAGLGNLVPGAEVEVL